MFNSYGNRSMRHTRSLWLVITILATVTYNAFAADQTGEWIGGVGNWGEDSNWDIGLVPNNAVQTFDAIIGDATGPVTLDLDVEIEALQLGNSDLDLGFHSLRLGADSTVAGQLGLNTGSSTLVIGGPLSITGAGVIVFDSPSARIIGDDPGSILTIGPGLTVLSRGEFGGGLIDVDLVNNGQVLATDGAQLRFGAITINNAAGRLSVNTPPQDFGGFFLGYVELNGTTVLGGTLDGGDALPGEGGEFLAYNGAVLDGIGMTIDNVGVRALDMTLRGSLENNGEIFAETLRIDGRTEVNGTGMVAFDTVLGAEIVSLNGSRDDVVVVGPDQTLGIADPGASGTIRTTVENDGTVSSAGNLTTAFAAQINRATVAALTGGTKTYQNAAMLNDAANLHADAGGAINFNSSLAILTDGSTLTGDGAINFNVESIARLIGTVTSDIAQLNFSGDAISLFSHTIEVVGASTLDGASGVNFTGKGLRIKPFTEGPGSTDALTIGATQSISIDGGFSGAEVSVPVTIDGSVITRNGPWRSTAPTTVNGTLRSELDGVLEIGADANGSGEIIGAGPQAVVFNNVSETQQIGLAVTAEAISVQGLDVNFTAPVTATGDVEIAGTGTFQQQLTAGHLQVDGTARIEGDLDAGSVAIGFGSDLQVPGTVSMPGTLSWNGRISGGGTVTSSGDVDIRLAELDGTTFDAFGTVTLRDQFTLSNGATFINNSNEAFVIPDFFGELLDGGCSPGDCTNRFIAGGTVTEDGPATLLVNVDLTQPADGTLNITRLETSGNVDAAGEFSVGRWTIMARSDATGADPTTVSAYGNARITVLEADGGDVNWRPGEQTRLNADLINFGATAFFEELPDEASIVLSNGASADIDFAEAASINDLAVFRSLASFEALVEEVEIGRIDSEGGVLELVGNFFAESIRASRSEILVAQGGELTTVVETPQSGIANVRENVMDLKENARLTVVGREGTSADNPLLIDLGLLYEAGASSSYSYLGRTPAGDIDGDGYPDLAVATARASGATNYSGRVYMLFDGDEANGLVIESTIASQLKYNIPAGTTLVAETSPDSDPFPVFDRVMMEGETDSTTKVIGGDNNDISNPLTMDSIAELAEGASYRHAYSGQSGGPAGDIDGDGHGDLLSVYGNDGGGRFYSGLAYLNYDNDMPTGTAGEDIRAENVAIKVYGNVASSFTVAAGAGLPAALNDIHVDLAPGSSLAIIPEYAGNESEVYANGLSVSAQPGSYFSLGSNFSVYSENGVDFNGDGFNDYRVGGNGGNGYVGAQRIFFGTGLSPGRAVITGTLESVVSEFEFEFGGLTPGDGYDQIVVDGAMASGDTLLDLLIIDGAESIIGADDVFTLIDTSLGFFGLVDGVASGERLATSDGIGSFRIFYGETSPFGQNALVATDFEPTVIPLPASAWMLLSALTVLGTLRRPRP